MHVLPCIEMPLAISKNISTLRLPRVEGPMSELFRCESPRRLVVKPLPTDCAHAKVAIGMYFDQTNPTVKFFAVGGGIRHAGKTPKKTTRSVSSREKEIASTHNSVDIFARQTSWTRYNQPYTIIRR